MNDPLASPQYRVGKDVSPWPYVKVARAAQHLADLQARISFWIATQPFTTVPELSPDRLTWSLRLRVGSPPPTEEWSIFLGDCIHNLRSALDASVWELSTKGGEAPDRPLDIQFPIVDDPLKWEAAAKRRLAGVPAPVIERIRIVQPMMRPDEEKPRDLLTLLQHLSNLDKHRSSISASIVPDTINADFSVQFESDEAATRNVPPNVTVHFPEIRDGHLIVEYATVDPIDETTGGFGLSLGIAVDTPSGNQPLFETVGGLVTYVGQVLSVMHGGATRDSDPRETSHREATQP